MSNTEKKMDWSNLERSKVHKSPLDVSLSSTTSSTQTQQTVTNTQLSKSYQRNWPPDSEHYSSNIKGSSTNPGSSNFSRTVSGSSDKVYSSGEQNHGNTTHDVTSGPRFDSTKRTDSSDGLSSFSGTYYSTSSGVRANNMDPSSNIKGSSTNPGSSNFLRTVSGSSDKVYSSGEQNHGKSTHDVVPRFDSTNRADSSDGFSSFSASSGTNSGVRANKMDPSSNLKGSSTNPGSSNFSRTVSGSSDKVNSSGERNYGKSTHDVVPTFDSTKRTDSSDGLSSFSGTYYSTSSGVRANNMDPSSNLKGSSTNPGSSNFSRTVSGSSDKVNSSGERNYGKSTRDVGTTFDLTKRADSSFSGTYYSTNSGVRANNMDTQSFKTSMSKSTILDSRDASHSYEPERKPQDVSTGTCDFQGQVMPAVSNTRISPVYDPAAAASNSPVKTLSYNSESQSLAQPDSTQAKQETTFSREKEPITSMKVPMPKIFKHFKDVFANSHHIQSFNVTVEFEQNDDLLYCILNGSTENLKKVAKFLERQRNGLTKEDVSFSYHINQVLKHLRIEDTINSRLRTENILCAVEQSENLLYLYGYDRAVITKGKTAITGWFIYKNHLLIGNLREKAHLVKKHLSEMFRNDEVVVYFDTELKCRLNLVGYKEKVDEALAVVVDLQEGRKSLPVSDTSTFLQQHNIFQKVSDKCQVACPIEKTPLTVTFTGTSQNVDLAKNEIQTKESSLCIDYSDFTVPNSSTAKPLTRRQFEEYSQKFDILLNTTVHFKCGTQLVTKEAIDNSSMWSVSRARSFALENISFDRVDVDIKVVLIGREGKQGFTLVTTDHTREIIEAEIPSQNTNYDGQNVCHVVENMVGKAIKNATDRRVKSIAFLVSHVRAWKMEDLMTYIVNGCVQWMLDGNEGSPMSVLLCTKDVDLFLTTDECIDRHIKTCMSETSAKYCMPEIHILSGHINEAKTDVIVSTAHPSLDLKRGMVSKSLLDTGGPTIQVECNQRYPQGIRYNEIAITDGYGLQCKKIFHITLPFASKSEEFMSAIRDVMQLCLKTAAVNGHRSIAFPAIGTGSQKYPTNFVASEMIMSIERFLQGIPEQKNLSMTLRDIFFYVHPTDSTLLQEFQRLKKRLEKPASPKSVSVSVRFHITGKQTDVDRCKKMLDSAYNDKMLGSLYNDKVRSNDRDQKVQPSPELPGAREFSWSIHTSNNRTYQCHDTYIKVYKANILNVPVDCIVNAANSDLQHNGGIAQDIAEAAGKQLRTECRQIIQREGLIHLSNVAHTSAGTLPYKYIIHAVGPRFHDYKPITEAALQKCRDDLKHTIINCLQRCIQLEVKTVAFSTVSSGVFGVPKDVCATVYAEALMEFCKSNEMIGEIHFVDISADMINIIHKTFNEMITKKQSPPYDLTIYIDKTNALFSVRTKHRDTKDRNVQLGKPPQTSLPGLKQQVSDRMKNTGRDRPKDTANPTSAYTQLVTATYISDKKQMQCSFVNRSGVEINVLVYKGDIVSLPGIEAVVCADNAHGEGKGIVAKLLLNEGGRYYEEVKRLQFKSRRNYGEVITTTGGSNRFKWVMHGISSNKDPSYTTVLYCNILRETKNREVCSVALPLLGTGAGGMDPRHSAENLFSELMNYCKTEVAAAFTIHVVLHDKTVDDIAKDVFKRNIDQMQGNQQETTGSVLHKKKQERVTVDENLGLPGTKTRMQTDKDTSPTTHKEVLDGKEDCVICMDKVTDAKRLQCGHVFCRDCIEGYFRVKQVCPTCGKVCGIITGDQPDGHMEISKRYTAVAGYEKCHSISITYTFANGTQEPNHPKPGTPYRGITRTAYLPDNDEGREVCSMLKVAFQRRLVFTIGASRTTGKEGVITWNDIHHKTDPRPHTQFGYPDTTYLARVRDELGAKGVTKQDVDSQFTTDLRRDSFRQKIYVDKYAS